MYKIENNKIIILNSQEFCPKHILECGQIFSYLENEEGYIVLSANKMAKIILKANNYIIETQDIEYFINFFDLNTNYTKIKKLLLNKHKFLSNAIEFGSGIRILKQDIFETIISFIISANNNIKRIQKILFNIRQKFGSNMGDFYAFPTIAQLKNATEQDFKDMGAGYRAKYLCAAVKQLEKEDLNSWTSLSTAELNKKLLSIMGVGQKVADCIMLFAFSKQDVFPVDTWIEKVHSSCFYKETNRDKIRQNLLNAFGNMSGYAQQYLFYSQRSSDL